MPRLLIIAFAVGTFLGSPAIGEQSKARHREQTGFSAEEAAVENPIAIPEDVREQLSEDEMVKGALEDNHLPAEKLPASWFSASSIHLSLTHKTPDLIVVGESSSLSGGNTASFWVFRATDSSHTLVMTTATHNLIVKNSAHHGYRDIELISMSASVVSTVICRFDGTKYKEYQSKSEPIR